MVKNRLLLMIQQLASICAFCSKLSSDQRRFKRIEIVPWPLFLLWDHDLRQRLSCCPKNTDFPHSQDFQCLQLSSRLIVQFFFALDLLYHVHLLILNIPFACFPFLQHFPAFPSIHHSLGHFNAKPYFSQDALISMVA